MLSLSGLKPERESCGTFQPFTFQEKSVFIDFGREICGEAAISESREWLVTNGIGGFACGTVGGMLTRRYHGLLVAALKPPLGRTLLVARLDESVEYDGQFYTLHADRRGEGPGTIDPTGFRFLERFSLQGSIPVWVYTFGDAQLEKRIWMQPGANTTYLQYTLLRASRTAWMSFAALVNYRDYHGQTRRGALELNVEKVDSGLQFTAEQPGAAPYYVLSAGATADRREFWQTGYALAAEQERGFDGHEDHFLGGEFQIGLNTGESVTFVATTDPTPGLSGLQAQAERVAEDRHLIALAGSFANSAPIRQLVLAADQFIVRRPSAEDPVGRSILAGFPWFSDWGRDTMIALPGLTLATRRPDIAYNLLRTFARHIDQGMLPNRFPDAGETPEYNTVDATLWFFEAIRAYHAATGDTATLRELYPQLISILEWHLKGTRYQIHVDPADGLLAAGEAGVQLTWMDAKYEDWVVTPRIGKPVEVNALWYNALRTMATFAETLSEPVERWAALAEQAQQGFQRFWNARDRCLYDVIDIPDGGADASIRPNQILAVSLRYSPLTLEQSRAVVERCARSLLTSHGLRSLAPEDPRYQGRYSGSWKERDSCYHQGTVWGWLIGPFVMAHLRVYRDPVQARAYLLPLLHHLAAAGLGSMSEIFDGDAPHTPRGCFAQAWTVAEVLRAWEAVSQADGAVR
jgi:predicted glycogen debranching enzyme